MVRRIVETNEESPPLRERGDKGIETYIEVEEIKKSLIRGESAPMEMRCTQKPDLKLVNHDDLRKPWYFTHT